MPEISNSRKKLKEAKARLKLTKTSREEDTNDAKESQLIPESSSSFAKALLKKNTYSTYVADCKFMCTTLALQGGSSTCGCVWCVCKRGDWPNLVEENILLRSIQSILNNADTVVNKNGLPKLNNSVYNFPLLKNIPISNYVPPPLHILLSLVNSIIKYIFKFAEDSSE